MPTARDVAEWMVVQFNCTRWLYQETIVHKIKNQYGAELVYLNANGNHGISKEVLKHFRQMTEGQAIWERGSRAWRHLRDGEVYKGRQQD
jgi:hypothetical protein